VLYLGSAKLAPAKATGEEPGHPLVAVSARGAVLPDQEAVLGALEGIILLDGNWSQAKALWWRNPWLLKLRRLILAPDFRSLYGKLRREPRAESISTIEAAGLCLAQLAGNPEILTRVIRPFSLLLRNYKDMRRAV
jgi:DTW domain-containing protein YfiP